MKDGPCGKCGSKDVAGGIRLMDRGDGGTVALRAHAKPEAWLFKGTVMVAVSARVCGTCGYVELYADNPRKIVAAARLADEASRSLE